MREPDWHTARRLAFAAAALPAEPVALPQAVGRTLAEPVRSLTDLPAHDTSAMDGWAVSGAGPWQIVGSVLAGHAPDLALHAGQACQIATGAVVPAGTTAIVRTEHGDVRDSRLQGQERPGDIRPAAQECRSGEELASAGTMITPAMTGMFAAAGLDDVSVRQRPRVAIVLFGDEIVERGLPGVGQVRDSLGPQLPAWLERMGAQVLNITHAPDTLAEHVAHIARAARAADVVITTGGTAAGPVDHVHAAVEEVGGSFRIDSVAVRPGHPMAMAELPQAWLLALPGNPQSAIVSLMSLGGPLFDSLLGREPSALPRVVLAESAPAPATEHRLLACRSDSGSVTPVAHLGSAMLRGLSAAEGFAVLPPGGAAAGDSVEWLSLP